MEEVSVRGGSEDYERQLWDELNSLLADVVPPEATEAEAEDAIFVAVMGADSEIADLYKQVRMIAWIGAGYLRERMDDDNPVSAVRQRLEGVAARQSAMRQ
jgi:hypothetical protein